MTNLNSLDISIHQTFNVLWSKNDFNIQRAGNSIIVQEQLLCRQLNLAFLVAVGVQGTASILLMCEVIKKCHIGRLGFWATGHFDNFYFVDPCQLR